VGGWVGGWGGERWSVLTAGFKAIAAGMPECHTQPYALAFNTHPPQTANPPPPPRFITRLHYIKLIDMWVD